MNVTLSNDVLTVVISTQGAELQSIRNNITGDEYLWQGNAAFWNRRSPVLFPIVGAVWNGEYRYNGVAYQLGQHGFARDMEFDIISGDDESEAWFALDANDTTLVKYPCRFRLEIGYALRGELISVMWRVHNHDSRDIYFQIGAHPAFNYPDFNATDAVHGYFHLDATAPLSAEVIEQKGCIGSEIAAVTLDAEGLLPITAATFARDAIILNDNQVHRVSLMSKDRKPYLTLLFNSPLVGLWSKSADAPFVCIEPWWGRTDRIGFSGDFSEREHITRLSPKDTFNASYSIVIDNL